MNFIELGANHITSLKIGMYGFDQGDKSTFFVLFPFFSGKANTYQSTPNPSVGKSLHPYTFSLIDFLDLGFGIRCSGCLVGGAIGAVHKAETLGECQGAW